MRIDKYNQPLVNFVQHKIDNQKKNVETKKKEKTDKVEITSTNTKKEDGIITSAKLKINNLPDVRETKVNEVKEKIKNGYYNSPEFISNLAQKMMDDGLLP